MILKIILIDEDCNCLQKNNIKETIKYISNSDDWFVLMTRENKLAQLAYSVDAIYKIVKKSTELTISPKYQKLYTKNSKYPIDTIMIEDSTTGFSFFKKCKQCESCEFKNFFIDSRKAFKLSKYSDYVIWK